MAMPMSHALQLHSWCSHGVRRLNDTEVVDSYRHLTVFASSRGDAGGLGQLRRRRQNHIQPFKTTLCELDGRSLDSS